MNPNEWQAWLARWLRLHPIKDPPGGRQESYPEEVMARIRAEQALAALPRRPFALRFPPRPAFALGALAAVLAVALLTRPSTETQIERIEEELQILAEVSEEDLEEFPPEEDPLEELLILEEVESA